MNNDFSRILTLLRKEKKLSQKQVAADLGISQALLSHYEKGIRECGLDFLIKAADYFNVSCDYLLGRTPQRYNDIADINDSAASSSKDKGLTISKMLLQSTQNVIYDYLDKIGNRKFSKNCAFYLMLSTYNIFRKIYSANEENPQDMFAVHKEVYSGFSTAGMEILLARISSATDPSCKTDYLKKCSSIELSPEILVSEYPQSASSIFNLIQYAESNLKFKK